MGHSAASWPPPFLEAQVLGYGDRVLLRLPAIKRLNCIPKGRCARICLLVCLLDNRWASTRRRLWLPPGTRTTSWRWRGRTRPSR